MPPFFQRTLSKSSLFQARDVSSELRSQWTNPGDAFSVLLILGGDVVAQALAQSTGWLIGPPSFSFGWVAYSVNALVAAVGPNRLMPGPDYGCVLINGRNGYDRENRSWILGRMIRDYEIWMDRAVRNKIGQMIEKRWQELKQDSKSQPERPAQVGLCVSIYRPDEAEAGAFGQPADRWLWIQSILVAVIQLGVAAIPCGISQDWSILLITACGIVLSSATASLPQWRKEKWACRRQREGKNIILTRGNGSQHAIVVLGCKGFLDLEDLAAGQTDANIATSIPTRITVAALALLWILVLITASGIRNHTWYLLAVGGIGILFNIYIAGNRKHPRSNGLPIRFEKVIGDQKVMQALYQVEEEVPYAGSSMLPTFFPGSLREDENAKWGEYRRTAKHRASTKIVPNTT